MLGIELNFGFNFFYSVIRVVLGFFLLLSGFLKTFDLNGFYKIVLQYGVLGPRVAKVLSKIQPYIEIVTGGILASGVNNRLGGLLAALFICVSTFFVFIALLKNKKISNCGCMGTNIKIPLSWWKFYDNLFWVLVSFFVFWFG